MDLLWDGARLFVAWARHDASLAPDSGGSFLHSDDLTTMISDQTQRLVLPNIDPRRKTARRVQTRSPLRIVLLRAATDDVYHASPDVNT